ncbi:MAG: hypothetical protein NWF01_08930 [Candidatus Bathyarchaeota archaeon]|nr:hypothetical protein [Candidatus Bathyarchaeota archaeon]
MRADRQVQLILALAVTAVFAVLSLTFVFKLIDYILLQQVTVVVGAILGSLVILAIGDKDNETTN